MKKFSEEKEAKAPCPKNVTEGLQKFFFMKWKKKYVPTHASIKEEVYYSELGIIIKIWYSLSSR